MDRRDERTPKEVVERGYDRIAERYLASKPPIDATTLALLEALVADLPPGAPALDLGCGAGVPFTRWLAGRCAVTGADLSARQIELARRNVPDATFIKADMATLDFPPGSFAAVVAFYSIIHVPREEHAALAGRIARWLRPGGRFLANWAIGAWEGEERDWLGWGAPMWWSHHDAGTNLALLREAGFAIERAETREADGEKWLWVVARKGGSVSGLVSGD